MTLQCALSTDAETLEGPLSMQEARKDQTSDTYWKQSLCTCLGAAWPGLQPSKAVVMPQ